MIRPEGGNVTEGGPTSAEFETFGPGLTTQGKQVRELRHENINSSFSAQLVGGNN